MFAKLGNSVAISDSFAIIGAYTPNWDNSAYIFKKNPNGFWEQTQKITSPDNQLNNSFAYAVDISNEYAIIGDFSSMPSNPSSAAGAAYIYKRDVNNFWNYISKLVPSDGVLGDDFGGSVSLSNNMCIVGAREHSGNRGAAYVFEENGLGNWVEIAKLMASDNAINDFFSQTTSISNNTIFIGAINEDQDEVGSNFITSSGSVYVFEKNSSGNWIEIQKIVAPDRVLNGYFGAALHLDGNQVIIGNGSINTILDNSFNQTSSAYIFEKNGLGIWEFIQKLEPPNPLDHLGFGNSVGLSGDFAIVSAIDEREDELGNFVGPLMGAVYAFKRQTDGTWQNVQRIIASDKAAGDYFGRSVAIEGNTLVVGAWQEDEDENGENTIIEAGSAYIFEACPVTMSTEVLTSCDSLRWRDGNVYTANNTQAQYTLDNAAGCDSIITLDLTIHRSQNRIENITTCDSYDWQGINYTTSGSYTYQSTTANGCDSIITLDLTINASAATSTTISACDSYSWQGNTYDQSGMYDYQTMTLAGCDSIVTLGLTIHPSHAIQQSVTACSSYNWNGSTYTQSGSYTFNTTNRFGCDSIVTLELTINTVLTTNQTIQACDSLLWNGTTYDLSGQYDYNTLSVLGCDSIVTLDLTIYPSTDGTVSATACGSYSWHNTVYAQGGSYTYQTQNRYGCDSTVTLFLTIHPTPVVAEQRIACDETLWQGISYDTSGIYTQNLQTIFGCDSTLTLELTIHHSDAIHLSANACDSYIWQGNTYTQSGSYQYQATNQFGCDSILTLELYISPSANTQVALSDCDSIIYQGQTLDREGEYEFALQSSSGCDSVVTVSLHLQSNKIEEEIRACEAYYWSVTEGSLTQSGTYTQRYTNKFGCDSVHTLALTIDPHYMYEEAESKCGSYTWPRTQATYTQSGQYSQALQTKAGCDSIYHLDLQILPNFTFIDTVVANNAYTWSINANTYQASGIFTESYTTINGCDSIHQLILTIRSISEINTPNIIRPNGNNNIFTIYSTTGQEVIESLSVYDRWGSLIFYNENFSPNDQSEGWDGKTNGKDIVPGVYIWTATIKQTNGSVKYERGDVTVVR